MFIIHTIPFAAILQHIMHNLYIYCMSRYDNILLILCCVNLLKKCEGKGMSGLRKLVLRCIFMIINL